MKFALNEHHGKHMYSISCLSIHLTEPIQSLIQWVPGALSPQVKWLG